MGRWRLAALVVATVLAACGGGADGNATPRPTDRDAGADDGACKRIDDDKLFDRYVTFMNPESEPREILAVLQFGDDRDVIEYVELYVASSQLYGNFLANNFADGGGPVGEPVFRLDSVEYLDEESVFVIFTVEQELDGGPANVQTVGRLLCVDGRWRVALNDVCVRMIGGEECNPELETLRRIGFESFERADIPDVVDPTVPTTVPPPPEPTIPPGPSDGFCPYVGQPCSANVTNDPDCVCQPTGGPGFGRARTPVLTCGATRGT